MFGTVVDNISYWRVRFGTHNRTGSLQWRSCGWQNRKKFAFRQHHAPSVELFSGWKRYSFCLSKLGTSFQSTTSAHDICSWPKVPLPCSALSSVSSAERSILQNLCSFAMTRRYLQLQVVPVYGSLWLDLHRASVGSKWIAIRIWLLDSFLPSKR